MFDKVRVRFAPSPTGPLHIGGVRTALFNYLFAKKHQGDFILRIEDTDQNRFVEGAEQYITNTLEWLGMPFDEGPGSDTNYGPYRQSERKEHYKKYVQQLLETGFAYYAFDTSESLNAHRKEHESQGKTFIYNWHNRLKLDNSLALSAEDVAEKLNQQVPYVVRFKCPTDRNLVLTDIVRGQIHIDTNTLDDKILFKSDGMPTYHLANVVDDHLMNISHVIRGEEWLPSLALHTLLYEAFKWPSPQFAHLPLILKPTGKGKLSKRDGEKGSFPVFPISWNDSQGYREAGFYPEAVINFLAFLGWNPGTEEEILSLEELISQFSLERVNKSGARFDPEKNKWYNHHYLQRKSNEDLAKEFQVTLLKQDKDVAKKNDLSYITQVVGLVKERANYASDFWSLSEYFFKAPKTFAEKAVRKQWKESTPKIMQELVTEVQAIHPFEASVIETSVKNWISEKELSFGQVMPPLRLALVGDLKGPDLFMLMQLLEKEECTRRIAHTIAIL